MIRLIICCVSLAALVASANAQRGEPIFFASTFGKTGAESHHLNLHLLERGHAATRERMARFYKEQDYRRFMVHLPFGRDQSRMQITDTTDAFQSPNLRVRAIAHSFVPQMMLFLIQHDDAELYVYLGSPHLDGVFRASGKVDEDDQASLWTEAIAPILDLNELFPGRVGLALDHAHVIKPDDPAAKLLLATHRQTGLSLMVEGGVHIEPWQAEAGFARMMIWTTFRDRLDAPLEGWPGEQVLLVNTSAQFRRAPEGWREDMEGRGFTVCGY